MQSRKKSNNDQPFTQAAQMILYRMETPARFIQFLTDAYSWLVERKSEEPNEMANSVFMLTRLINDLALPLISPDDKKIEAGFKNFLDCHGPAGYHDQLMILMECFGKYGCAGYPGETTWKFYSDGIATLFDLYVYFKREWDDDLERNGLESTYVNL
jgi:hypothetical protein